MEYFLTPQGLQDLMALLVVCIGLAMLVSSFVAYCRKLDQEGDLDDEPLKPRMYGVVEDGVYVIHDRFIEDPEWRQQAIRQGYKLNREPIESAASVLDNIGSLRTDLRNHKNATQPGDMS